MCQRFGTMLTLITISGCGGVSPIMVTDLAEVQRLARITIPPSAIGLQCRTESGIDPLVYGRFDIPASDLQAVLEQMPKSGKVEPYIGYSNVTSHQIQEDWWRPDQLREPKIVEWTEPGFSINLMFGEAGPPGTLTLYFFNFGM